MMGKFTMSVKRIVQEVKEEGVPSDSETREDSISANQVLRAAKGRLQDSHETARQALLTLHKRFQASRASPYAWQRYRLLKAMIKDVVRLDTEYWHLLDVPKQGKQENVNAFVMRVCHIIEKGDRAREHGTFSAAVAAEKAPKNTDEEERKRENAERLYAMTTGGILEENTALTNEIYRCLRRYQSLRALVRELKEDYTESKIYPFLPRYFMLKDMIRDVVTDPTFVEISHEAHDNPASPAPGNSGSSCLTGTGSIRALSANSSLSQPNSPSLATGSVFSAQ